ncbi:MAG: sel1 repeat family protein [Thiobacillus sp.]|jgi:hypothetical protein|nr:sel1 repeat family protein [Thiobacillus sp.]
MIRTCLALCCAFSILVVPFIARAGFEEGEAAYHAGDYKKALAEFRPLADQGNADAQFNLGEMYAYGHGVPQDYKEAVSWYRRAAERGHIRAQKNLGIIYAYGLEVPQDYREAAVWNRRAAEQGDEIAQFVIGEMYAVGQGVPQDYKEAAVWYRRAAEQGYVLAQYDLGVMYYHGQGLPQDLREAADLFRRAAAWGYARAQYNLGVMYDSGQGVPQDYKEAVVWYRRAAEQGNADAQNNLGVMYANGRGVPQDRVLAYALYNLSAANDPSADNKATDNRAQLAEQLNNNAIEAAQALTRELARPGNFGRALDAWLKKPAHAKPADASRRAKAEGSPDAPAATGGFPPRPAKVPGRVSCNTRCVNAQCWRTYDNGRKVKFIARQKWNPFENRFEWDSGSC